MTSLKSMLTGILLLLSLALGAMAQASHEAALKSLKFREIGPAIMGGRVDDFAVVDSDPRIMYVGSAAGGVFKTTNAGTNWEPVFDEQPNSSIGDIALAPSDPSVLYVGTGEPNNRQSSSWGGGVYKSLDAGKTWTFLGLKDTHHIGRIVVHPTEPNVVYVAALGHLWGPNKERGVYKSTDGGATWTQSLFINDDTGVSDIAIDPQSPNTLYAAAYERRRTVFGFNGGGPGGGIYKTVDGGVHWTKLTHGLPTTGDVGRCAIDIYRKNSNIVYVLIEHATQGGIYRSEDKGFSWTRMSDTNPRPSYYSQVRIDPNNDRKVWVLGAPLYLSEDGGKTFTQDRAQRIHSDFHAMWIDPSNSDHVVLGSDGGITVTYDSGKRWDYVNNLPLGQFYEIAYNMEKPYRVCGGLQDNYSWCGPSASLITQGIANDEWINIGGGDGFDTKMDPNDANIVYTESQDGGLLRRDLRTGESRSIRPQEDNDKAPRYRFQWNSPLVMSSHDAKTLYYGGNHLFKSTDRGDSWTRLGPDLTTGIERDKQPILGKVPDKDTLSRHDGVQNFPCATTVAESPVKAGILWVGTDDGNLQVTRDDGKTWSNVVGNVPGLKKGAYVAKVEASRKDEGTAYVAFDNHRADDFSTYLYMTTDYGKSWHRITNGIPAEAGTMHVVREDQKNPNLLFAGAEFGLFVSFDRGAKWERMKNGLPTVPVDDILIHPREHDLILGTHGRSIWIMDDITPLEEMSDNVASADLHLFGMRTGTTWHVANYRGFTGTREFLANNPPNGVIVDYFLKKKIDGRNPVRITITDKAGNRIRELQGPGEEGVNRVAWDLHYDSPVPPGQGGGFGGGRGAGGGGGGGRGGAGGDGAAAAEAGAGGEAGAEAAAEGGAGGGGGGRGGGGGGGGFGFGGGRGPTVDPGEYNVTIAAAGKTDTKTVTVEEDPRVTMSAADRTKRRQALTKLYALTKEADSGRRKIVAMQTSLTSLTDSWRRPGAPHVPEDVRKSAEGLLAKVKDISGVFEQQRGGQLGGAGPPLTYTPPPVNQKIGRLMNSIDSYSGAPTDRQLADIDSAASELQPALAIVNKLADEDLPALNKQMAAAGVPYVTADTAPAPPQGRRGR